LPAQWALGDLLDFQQKAKTQEERAQSRLKGAKKRKQKRQKPAAFSTEYNGLWRDGGVSRVLASRSTRAYASRGALLPHATREMAEASCREFTKEQSRRFYPSANFTSLSLF
jgi:hypothetical protein